jgi:hypothetical protein
VCKHCIAMNALALLPLTGAEGTGNVIDVGDKRDDVVLKVLADPDPDYEAEVQPDVLVAAHPSASCVSAR